MGRIRRERRRTVFLLAVAALATGVGLLTYATQLLGRSEQQTVDARFAIRGTQRPPSNIVFVAISLEAEKELREHHLEARSPLPRSYDAHVVDRLRAAGARTIAMDMEFTEQTNPAEDNDLIEAVGRAHGKVVLATTQVSRTGTTMIFGGEPLLRELGARPAEARLTLDSDGSVRRFEREYNHLGSFPVVATEVMIGRPVSASTFERRSLPIDYVGPRETFKSISYAKVLMGNFPPGLFKNKLVIVGASSPALQDLHPTPTTTGVGMPGPEIWANAASTLLRGVPLRNAPGWLNVALIVLLGVAVPLGSLGVRPRLRSLLYAVALAVVFAVAAQLAFDNGRIVAFVYPLLALALGTLGTFVVLYMAETIERERVRDVFSRFVPAGVVDEVLARTDKNLRLGGMERDCTVLFCDLRGFTSFSETQPAARVIDVVNFYLNEMSEAILDAGGTLVGYMGDGIMAIFGAPLEQDDHADRAVSAAREMIGPRLARFNAWLAEQGFERGFAIGVGLDSGTVMAGNVGSEQRVAYTALGDTTNTASRLESMTKEHEAMLFISASTRARLRAAPDELSPVGEFEIRGRVGTVGVWTIWPSGVDGKGGVAGDSAYNGPAQEFKESGARQGDERLADG
jgi:adenylate cyclase